MRFENSGSYAGYRPIQQHSSHKGGSSLSGSGLSLVSTSADATPSQSDQFNPSGANKNMLQIAEAHAVPQLSTGIGLQVAHHDKQLFTDAKNTIYQKIHWANIMGTVHKDPVSQVKMLLSGFSDAEWYIGNILADFNGVELPPDARDSIASMRALEGVLIANIRNATGMNLSDDEFRALLEKDPGSTTQNIPLNELIRNDKTLKPGPDSNSQPSDQAMDADIAQHKSQYMGNDSIYGIKSNPGKYQNAMASANQKVTQEMDSIIRQASAVVGNAEHDPAGNLDALMSALRMLQRGKTITMVAGALDNYQPASMQGSSYADKKGQFEQLLQKTVQLLKSQGIPADQLVSPGSAASLDSSGSARGQ